MKRLGCRIITYTVFLILLLSVLWLALVGSAMIPNELLYDNFLESALYYVNSEAFDFDGSSHMYDVSDNYADAILCGVAWQMGKGDSPFVSTLDTGYHDGGYSGHVGLIYSVTTDEAPNVEYTRYWHGSAMFVRLFHLFTNANGIKLIGLVAAMLLILLTAVLLIRRGHFDIAALLILSMAAVHVWNIRLSLEYQPAFIITFLLCPLYLLLERKKDEYLYILSIAGGALIAFFDFLTTETMSILISLILVIAIRAKENRLSPLKDTFRLLIACGACWALAYAGTFVAKWTLASVVTGENAFALALASVNERIGGEILAGTEQPTSFLSPLWANLTVLFGGTIRVQMPQVIVYTLIIIALLSAVWFIFKAPKFNKDASLPLLALGAIVLIRFLLLNNHSYLHEFFTYRALSSSILAMLIALRLNIAPKSKQRRQK